MKKLFLIFISVLICFSFASCNKSDATPNKTSAVSIEQPEIGKDKKEATIYIGRSNTFSPYKVSYEETLTPELLLEKIEELTGWDLTLFENVISEKNEMYVNFSKQSSVYSGDAKNAKGEFAIEKKDDLISTILDSVCKTLQSNFADPALGESDKPDITYSCEGEPIDVGGSIVLTDIAYSSKAVEKYNDAQFTEFLTNQLSNYYESTQTSYEKVREVYENGSLIYVYAAINNQTKEQHALYGVTSDMLKLYEFDGENMELLLDFSQYID